MDTIIYGMGGGKMSDPRMTYHYRRIVDLAKAQFGLDKPHVAIVPTAHFNGTNAKIGRGNIDFIFERLRSLGCDTQQILMGDVPAGQSETRDSDTHDILGTSHAVFVLGGDTRYLLEVVREKGLVSAFESIFHDGKVMAGTSAGFIWLTKHCMSDAESFHSKQWRYIMLQGLGILSVAGNAHDNGPLPEGLVPQVSRREQFEGYFAQLGELPGIVVDEFAAIEVRNFMCQPRSSNPAIGAYVLANGPDGIARRKIAPGTAVDLRDAAALRNFALSFSN
jgi:cyanophycinase-like exopeptidase